ncbi:MAG: sigma-70 family RNA polymerase sigma factor [Gammaproteobacteria bacterium]
MLRATRHVSRTMPNIVTLGDTTPDPAAAERAAETRLLERVRDAGDRAAFERLFALFTPRLTAWITAQGCEPTTAESVVQDVMVTAWTRAHLFDGAKASARTWMYTLARNRMIDHFRAGERRNRAHDGFATIEPVLREDSEPPERDANRARVAALLEELPPEQRRILLLVYVEGRSHREIAEMLGLPIGTVKSRTRLAFNRLRKLMEGEA